MAISSAQATETPELSLADAIEILWSSPTEERAENAVAALAHLAEQGDAEAQLRLGRMYWTGDYVAVDSDKAIDLLTAAATQGNAEAQWMLGEVHSSGVLGPRDYAEMAKWYLMAAKAGDPRAQFAVAQLAAPQDMYRSIFKSAGPILPKDDTVALEWLKKAANGGWPPAQRQLAIRYLYGLGVPADAEKFSHWLRLGLEKLQPSLPRGFDINKEMKDLENGWFSRSPSPRDMDDFMLSLSNRGYGFFGWNVGNMWKLVLRQLPKGQSSAESAKLKFPPRSEIFWRMVDDFESSARAGYPSGMEDYGLLLIEGKGVIQDVETGRNLLRRATLKGNGDAAGNLGWELAFDDEFRQAYIWLLIGGKLGSGLALDGLRLHVLPYIDERDIPAFSAEANRLANEHGLEFYRQGDPRYWCLPALLFQCQ